MIRPRLPPRNGLRHVFQGQHGIHMPWIDPTVTGGTRHPKDMLVITSYIVVIAWKKINHQPKLYDKSQPMVKLMVVRWTIRKSQAGKTREDEDSQGRPSVNPRGPKRKQAFLPVISYRTPSNLSTGWFAVRLRGMLQKQFLSRGFPGVAKRWFWRISNKQPTA